MFAHVLHVFLMRTASGEKGVAVIYLIEGKFGSSLNLANLAETKTFAKFWKLHSRDILGLQLV